MAKESTNVTNNQETTKESTSKIVNERTGLVYDPDNNKLVVKGILTSFRFATTRFQGDKEVYQVSVKTNAITPELINDMKARYFSDTKDKYLPSFFKDFEKEPEKSIKDGVYINLKSQYEFGTFLPNEGNKRYSFDDVIEMGEGLAPLKSEVTLSMRLKDNSIYPLALRIDKLNKQDASDYFE